MGVSEFSSLRSELRTAIRDLHGLQWSDTALDAIINEAQREYALYSSELTSSFEVIAHESGIQTAPVDFIEPLRYVTPDGFEHPIVSWRYLHERHPDFRKIDGSYGEALCFDFDGFGKYRIFPRLAAGSPAGCVYYRRLPAKDKLEFHDTEPIVQHSLYQLFLLTGKGSAVNYFDRFVRLVNRESRSSQTLRNRRSHRCGSYY